ncbi:hypothetical protein FOC4_g10005892 [Fusarium odoratissimum]|uniref:Uncharacterized protein n=1 Tax=Fusarium oxysporum f. sp. cubense (strain race 4) TaxID=2502994 RepID=N1RME5_FUSC4|nr:hypothetical protein FOC4_g10005892 [Fusarium odoratissimum]
MSRPIKCIGMKVDAYILNTSVVGRDFFLAPVTQPSYEKLLPGQLNLRPDVTDHIDLRNASQWQVNQRIANLETGELDKRKIGIYVHWCLPKPFRVGKADADRSGDSVEAGSIEVSVAR